MELIQRFSRSGAALASRRPPDPRSAAAADLKLNPVEAGGCEAARPSPAPEHIVPSFPFWLLLGFTVSQDLGQARHP